MPEARRPHVSVAREVVKIGLKGKKIVLPQVSARVLTLLILAAVGHIFADDVVLPDGKGRDAVENACTVCHTADRITRQSLTADQWRSEVRTMVENGASLNPDEWDPVVAYLTKFFGPKINVNKSTAQEISAGLQLTMAEAEAIVAYRSANGVFKDIKDLAKVPGLDAGKIAARENRLAF
jgi:competence protein ComEA